MLLWSVQSVYTVDAEADLPTAGPGLFSGLLAYVRQTGQVFKWHGGTWQDVAPAGGAHTHPISDVTNLQSTLDGKAASSHTHAQSEIVGLVAALAAKLDASVFQTLVQSSNAVTGANTTPINCPGLVFSFVANGVYFVEFYAITSASATTTGSGFALDTNVVVSLNVLTFDHPLANTGTRTGGSSIADDTFTGVSSGRPTASVISLTKGAAILVAGANGGTAQLRYRSGVAAVSTCHSGSILRVQRVA